MSSFFKKQILLAFGLIASSLAVIASDYQYKRLNGTVMPSTGESKTVTIEVPVSQVPLYVFLDYNGQIPLSQRLEISSGSSKAEVTLLPVSQQISIHVISQADVHTYLNSAEKNRIQQEGVQIVGQAMPPLLQQHYQEIEKNMKLVAHISYDKIAAGQVIALPNPFEEVKAEQPEVMAEQPEVTAEESSVEEPSMKEESLVEPEEPTAAESSVKEPLAQPEMMQPTVSDMENEEKDFSDKDVENNNSESKEVEINDVENESPEEKSQEGEMKENEE